ncbi:hypothetical protein AB835_11870 [Candidatus Endobugula sertula]|uniref:Uncharacterized protein n=1 Tax=Candidatus Endobugula sertula TaxID=62101 RepID=A0A1D2QMN7_9GAMM|nr:hypothetical protein AB835_11870 [Candidatus Endobugula sertula]
MITFGGVYFFTSGSTGIPKMIFHDVKTLTQMVETFTLLYPRGVHYTTTPLTGLGSVQFLMLALHLESPYIIGGSLEKAIAQLSSSDIQAVIFTYPSLLINYALSSDDHGCMPLLGEINLGGEPILETDTLTLSKIFGCKVRWAYGAAEVGPLAEGIGFQNGQAVYQPIKNYIQLQVRDSGGLNVLATVNTFNSAYVANNRLSYFGKNYHTGDVASVVSRNQFFIQDRGYKNIEDNQLIDRLNTQLNKLGKQYDTVFFRIVTVELDHQTTLRVICFARESERYNDIVADLYCSIDSEALDVKCYSAPRLLQNGKLDLQYYKTKSSVLEALESTE